MGLRESLRDFLTMQEVGDSARQATQKYAADTEALAKKEDLRALASEMPGLLQSGQVDQIAGRAYGLGDTATLQKVLTERTDATKAKAAAANDAGMSLEDLRVNYPEIDDAKLQSLANIKSFADQQKALNTGAAITGNQLNREIKYGDSQERKDDKLQKTRTDFSEKVTKGLEPIRKEVDQLSEIANRDFQDTTEFWLTATKILKSIGGEAGALTDSDLERPFPATAGRSIKTLATWMGARDPQKTPIDPKTIESVKGIVEAALANRKARLESRSAEEIQKGLTARRDRLVKADEGYVDPIAQEVANSYGQVVSVDKNGKISVGKSVPQESQKVKLDPDLKGGKDAMELINGLSDKNKAFALQKLRTFKGTVPVAFMAKLKELQGK
jgi:hypothetical protein